MLKGELSFNKLGYRLIAGSDEAGRGPLAGPLYVGAVLFPEGYRNKDLDDSKKLTEKERERLFDIIVKDALAYSIVSLSPEDVDRLNPLEASRNGMKIALNNIYKEIKFDLAITDDMPLGDVPFKVEHFEKADGTYLCVAAASILAKVSRDRFMIEIDKKYPGYGFAEHKGYGTPFHLKALMEKGPIEGLHRFSYRPVKESVSPENWFK